MPLRTRQAPADFNLSRRSDPEPPQLMPPADDSTPSPTAPAAGRLPTSLRPTEQPRLPAHAVQERITMSSKEMTRKRTTHLRRAARLQPCNPGRRPPFPTPRVAGLSAHRHREKTTPCNPLMQAINSLPFGIGDWFKDSGLKIYGWATVGGNISKASSSPMSRRLTGSCPIRCTWTRPCSGSIAKRTRCRPTTSTTGFPLDPRVRHRLSLHHGRGLV